MGDRCYLEVRVRAADLPKFFKATELDEDFVWDKEKAISVIVDEEANYAMCDELQRANEQKIDFIGWHSEGGDYPAMNFVCIDGTLNYVRICAGDIVVSVHANGKANAEDLKNVREYRRLACKWHRRVNKANKARVPGVPAE